MLTGSTGGGFRQIRTEVSPIILFWSRLFVCALQVSCSSQTPARVEVVTDSMVHRSWIRIPQSSCASSDHSLYNKDTNAMESQYRIPVLTLALIHDAAQSFVRAKNSNAHSREEKQQYHGCQHQEVKKEKAFSGIMGKTQCHTYRRGTDPAIASGATACGITRADLL